MTDLFQSGNFKLHSGQERSWKIECDNLSNSEIATLVQMALPILPPFAELVSVPRGGDRIVRALTPFLSLEGCRLIVDDVLTTGNSMEEIRKNLPLSTRTTWGFVLFSCKPHPAGWIVTLFTMGIIHYKYLPSF